MSTETGEKRKDDNVVKSPEPKNMDIIEQNEEKKRHPLLEENVVITSVVVEGGRVATS